MTDARPGSTASPVPDRGILYKADSAIVEHRNESGYYGDGSLYVSIDHPSVRHTAILPHERAMDLAAKMDAWRMHQIRQMPVRSLSEGGARNADHPAPRLVAWTWEHCRGLMALRYELAEDIWNDAIRPVVTNIAQTLRAQGSVPPNEVADVLHAG